jgi:hypothetical protein
LVAGPFHTINQKPMFSDNQRYISWWKNFARGYGVLAENDVLVAMHDLDSPMIAIAGQQSLRRGGAQAGDEMNDLVLRRLPLAVFLELAPTFDPADLPDRRPLALNPGGGGRQHIDGAPFDAPMRLFDAAIPCAQGEKPAR